MIARLRILVCLSIALWTTTAAAQPLFRTEHDWTITIADEPYGLKQVVQTPGDFRTTTIHVGGHTFQTRWRAAALAAVIVATPLAALLFALSCQWRKQKDARRP